MKIDFTYGRKLIPIKIKIRDQKSFTQKNMESNFLGQIQSYSVIFLIHLIFITHF